MRECVHPSFHPSVIGIYSRISLIYDRVYWSVYPSDLETMWDFVSLFLLLTSLVKALFARRPHFYFCHIGLIFWWYHSFFTTWHFFFRVHELPQIPCPHCPFVAQYDTHIKRHIKQKHTNSKMYPCPEVGCHQTYTTPSTLRQHRFLHLNIKPYRCKWCNFSGIMPSNNISQLL